MNAGSMQAESVKTSPLSPLVSVGRAIAFTVIMGMSVAVLPFVPPLFFPFLALPLAHVVARLGIQNGAIVAVATGALVYVGVGAEWAMLVFLMVVGMGGAIAWALHKHWKFGPSLAITSGSALVAWILWGLFLWLALGATLTRLREILSDAIDQVATRYTDLSVSTGTIQEVTAWLRHFVDVVAYVVPGLLCMGAIMLTACSLGLAHLIFPRVREKVAVAFSFSKFRMHWGVAYASIAGLAMLLFYRGGSEWSHALSYVGINVLLVSQTLFGLQGLAVVNWFAVSRQMRGRSRIALCILAVLGPVLFAITGLLGLFDTWVDFRRRFAIKDPGGGPVT